MAIQIDKIEMFKEALSTGINLFTGAGFSKLPDATGNTLPDASELCGEICHNFSISATYTNDLERLSNIVNLRAKTQFQEYLRKKYTVTSYNKLYDVLNLVKINSFITTNIDNIIQCVMDDSTNYSLHSVVEYGAAKKDPSVIPFIPLHGNVKDITSHLYFGKNELANVDSDNRELFDTMHAKLLEAPTLFWGYGFHDNAIERTITRIFEKKRQEIWIQCMPGSDNIEYFRDLGCYVIEGTTENLLLWIQKNCNPSTIQVSPTEKYESIKKYFIPSLNQIETVSLEDYYTNGYTHWYCILSNYPCEVQCVNLLYESSLTEKNVIAIGIPFSGKTTNMMQLAAKNREAVKLIISDITPDEAKRIINVLRGQSAVVFVDNCCDDANVTKMFMQQPNIRVIGFCDDYAFESSKHLFDPIPYLRVETSELPIEDAQRIYEKIPELLRARKFSYKQQENEKFSMLEMINQNVNGVLSKDRIRTLLKKIQRNSTEAFQVIILATYLACNKSSLNTDILCSFFNTTDYEKLNRILCSAKGYLQEVDVEMAPDELDQSYYSVRSNLFARLAFSVLLDNFKDDFGVVIRRFILNVSPYKIYKYYVFKRSAFDARNFIKLYGTTAHDLYDHIYNIDESAYTLQQWALYKAYLGDFAGAFADIDKAVNKSSNNFSIKNSRAIILFEANKKQKTAKAEEGMQEAMQILQQCFSSDKRKVYHAQKYAEFSLFLAKEWGNPYYLTQAKEWLKSIVDRKESTSVRTTTLLKEVSSELVKHTI